MFFLSFSLNITNHRSMSLHFFSICKLELVLLCIEKGCSDKEVMKTEVIETCSDEYHLNFIFFSRCISNANTCCLFSICETYALSKFTFLL